MTEDAADRPALTEIEDRVAAVLAEWDNSGDELYSELSARIVALVLGAEEEDAFVGENVGG